MKRKLRKPRATKKERGRFMPLQGEKEFGEMLLYLTALCQQMHLSSVPTFVWEPSNLRVRGVAFGRPGRYYVALSAGLVHLFAVDREYDCPLCE